GAGQSGVAAGADQQFQEQPPVVGVAVVQQQQVGVGREPAGGGVAQVVEEGGEQHPVEVPLLLLGAAVPPHVGFQQRVPRVPGGHRRVVGEPLGGAGGTPSRQSASAAPGGVPQDGGDHRGGAVGG